MAQEKISFEQFFATVDPSKRVFVQELHDYLLDKGCKVSFEEKKSGMLASYKIGKPPRALLNLLFRKSGMLVRIYGEHASMYHDFLQTLPSDMVQSIAEAGDCGRLLHGTCSPKCSGYDVSIKGERHQKCRYGGFEFLITEESGPHIRHFVAYEIAARTAG